MIVFLECVHRKTRPSWFVHCLISKTDPACTFARFVAMAIISCVCEIYISAICLIVLVLCTSGTCRTQVLSVFRNPWRSDTSIALQVKPTDVSGMYQVMAILADAGLKIAATSREKMVAPNQSVLECGAMNLLDHMEVSQVFTLFNANKTPLVVERLQPSCGCMTALLPQPTGKLAGTKQSSQLPLTLGSNESMQVKVTIHLDLLPAGPFNKSVSIYVQGVPRPAAMLQLTGTLQPNVTLTPNVLDFGKVAVGTTPSLTLTATYGNRLKAGIPLPRLVSHNPYVSITPLIDLPLQQPKPAGKRPVRPRIQRYRVTLKPGLESGSLTDTLDLLPAETSPGPGVPGVKVPAHLAAALKQVTAMIVGQVVGNVDAQPPVLAFGSVNPGRAYTRQIVLRAKKAAALQNVKLAANSSWLAVQLNSSGAISPLMAAGRAAEATRVVDVTLSGETPAGLLSSRITVTLNDGERLTIPVQAYILPKAP
jgi:hypothetical protein